jgi:beta-xylosidase
MSHFNHFKVNLNDVKAGVPLITGDIGYDEFAGTLTDLGITQLLSLKQAKKGTFRYIRIHNIFSSKEGDNRGARDAGGDPVRVNLDGSFSFDWTLIDTVLYAILESRCIPFIELGFTPTPWSTMERVLNSELGDELKWKVNKAKPGSPACYPPRDFKLWESLVDAFLVHLQTEFGENIKEWPFELWNEPDIGYFKGTVQQYCELWYVTYRICKQFGLKMVGAPAVAHGTSFLELFCKFSIESHTKPDFISYHLKAGHEPDLNKGAASLHTLWIRALTLRDAIPRELRSIPIWITEFDPITGCEMGIKDDQGWGFQNKAYYPAWLGQACYMLVCLQQSRDINTLEEDPDLESLCFDAIFNDNHHITAETTPFYGARCMCTPIWVKSSLKQQPNSDVLEGGKESFSKLSLLLRKIRKNPENYPSYNEALRDLESRIYHSNEPCELRTIIKPIYRAFECIKSFQGRFLPFGNRAESVYGVLCSNQNDIFVIVVNQPEPIKDGPYREISLEICGLNGSGKYVLAESIRIDSRSANPYETWLQMGSPNEISEMQYQELVQSSIPKPVDLMDLEVQGNSIRFSLQMESHSFHFLHFHPSSE